MTTKYVADDGREFDTEKECLEWEKEPKVYLVMSGLMSVDKAFSNKEVAEEYLVTRSTGYIKTVTVE